MMDTYKNEIREHTWPSNVQELKNVIQSAMFLTNNKDIDREDVPKIIPADVNKITETIPKFWKSMY